MTLDKAQALAAIERAVGYLKKTEYQEVARLWDFVYGTTDYTQAQELSDGRGHLKELAEHLRSALERIDELENYQDDWSEAVQETSHVRRQLESTREEVARLQQERVNILEQACRAVCRYCKAGEDLFYEEQDDRYLHKRGIEGHERIYGGCRAEGIRKLLADQGQGQPSEREEYTETELRCTGCMGPCGQCE